MKMVPQATVWLGCHRYEGLEASFQGWELPSCGKTYKVVGFRFLRIKSKGHLSPF